MSDANQTPAAEPPFRFTRESRIRIDRDGYVWHEGEKVAHEKLARALASWVAIDPETDRYVLRNPLDWCFITVDDAPLVVRSVRVHGATVHPEQAAARNEAPLSKVQRGTSAPVSNGRSVVEGFEIELSDGSVEPLDLATVRIDADDVPYCEVRKGTLPARFSRSAAFALLENANAEGDRIVFATPNGPVTVKRVGRGEGAPHREPAHPER